jgi:site-specific DNA-methyltransferase (adenine-specific)
MKSVWEVLPPTREEKLFGKHPAQKPVALLERIILASSNEGDLVLDPFMGSGTTAVAALRTKRKFAGTELDPRWNDISIERIRAEFQYGPRNNGAAPKLFAKVVGA